MCPQQWGEMSATVGEMSAAVGECLQQCMGGNVRNSEYDLGILTVEMVIHIDYV